MISSAGERARPELGAAIERHRPALWRYLRCLGADDATADDLAQDVFVVALARPGFDASEPAQTFAFLRTTARHLWLKSQQRRVSRREVAHADEVWDRSCGDGIGDGHAFVAALRACVEQLPARSRELLAATYEQRLGRAEIAARFAISEHGVKSALRRLRTSLQRCIERRSTR